MKSDLYLQLDQYFTTGMSPFQMRNFVIKDFMTAYRQMRQLIVEIRIRVDNRASIALDKEELEVDLEKLLATETIDPFEKRRNDIARRRLELQLSQKTQQIIQVSFEIDTFNEQLNGLIEQMGGVETVMINLASPEFHEREEARYWTEKMASSAHSDLINYGTVSKGVIDSIKLLPAEAQKEVFEKALAQQMDTIQELKNYRDNVLVIKD